MELPMISWDEMDPKFYIKELSHHDTTVQKQFTFPYVRYAGSHLGCGCGFFKDGIDPEELEEAQDNYRALAGYIDKMMQQGATCTAFSCWEGDQGKPQEHKIKLTTIDLISPDFEFKEKAFYEFS